MRDAAIATVETTNQFKYDTTFFSGVNLNIEEDTASCCDETLAFARFHHHIAERRSSYLAFLTPCL